MNSNSASAEMIIGKHDAWPIRKHILGHSSQTVRFQGGGAMF